MKKFIIILINVVLSSGVLFGQASGQEDEYTKVITGRAEKIILTLNMEDELKAIKVRDIIVQQYRNLSETHDGRDEKLKEAKKIEDKETAKTVVKNIETEANLRLFQLHREFVAKLTALLYAEQVDKVKDGMTYGVVPGTYKNYLAMLPELTEEQKTQILAYLIEAREYAMDGGTSKEKHAWFGKYKGKINNYLSAEGYDLKKAGEEWQERLKAEAEQK